MVGSRAARHLPNLVVIGAPKCGTTSLHHYLGLHPEIIMSRQKELNFFQAERNWSRGTGWYMGHFRGEASVFGESSPEYSNCVCYQGVPERMYSLLPGAKLIYLVRDPIERMLSQYVHSIALGVDEGTLEENLTPISNANPYIAYSKYCMQLERYLEKYPQSSILLLTTEELLDQRHETLRATFRFLGVDESFSSRHFATEKNTSREVAHANPWARRINRAAEHRLRHWIPEELRSWLRRFALSPFRARVAEPRMQDELRWRIAEHLEDDLSRLRRLTGRSFSSWSI